MIYFWQFRKTRYHFLNFEIQNFFWSLQRGKTRFQNLLPSRPSAWQGDALESTIDHWKIKKQKQKIPGLGLGLLGRKSLFIESGRKNRPDPSREREDVNTVLRGAGRKARGGGINQQDWCGFTFSLSLLGWWFLGRQRCAKAHEELPSRAGDVRPETNTNPLLPSRLYVRCVGENGRPVVRLKNNTKT